MPYPYQIRIRRGTHKEHAHNVLEGTLWTKEGNGQLWIWAPYGDPVYGFERQEIIQTLRAMYTRLINPEEYNWTLASEIVDQADKPGMT